VVYFHEQNSDFVTNLDFLKSLRCVSGVVKPLSLRRGRNRVGEGRMAVAETRLGVTGQQLSILSQQQVPGCPLQMGNTTVAREYQ